MAKTQYKRKYVYKDPIRYKAQENIEGKAKDDYRKMIAKMSVDIIKDLKEFV